MDTTSPSQDHCGLALTPSSMATQASCWAPLTDAVVTHVIVPVVTLLPGLQHPVPTGAAVVYSVVHGIEGGQLAKETHHSYQGQYTRQLQAGQAIGTGVRGSRSRGALLWSSPPLPHAWIRSSQ